MNTIVDYIPIYKQLNTSWQSEFSSYRVAHCQAYKFQVYSYVYIYIYV